MAEPSDDEVLVQVMAAPINPSDFGLLLRAAQVETAEAGGTADRPATVMQVPPVDDNLVIVNGAIREGRSIKERQQLLRKLSKGIATTMNKPENELILSLNEITSATAMEFGLILPQPGGEPEWFEKNKEALKGVVGTGHLAGQQG